jgi:molybdenum cofactor synthesis domain-containing protein
LKIKISKVRILHCIIVIVIGGKVGMMKKIPVREAVGTVLCHDLTQIIPGQMKGPAFSKGHILREEDIPRLLDMGKEHIFVWEIHPGLLHENDAADRIARAASGRGLELSTPREGKIDLVATEDGLLAINVQALYRVNESEEAILVTLHTHQIVTKGTVVAGARIIPLVIEEEKIRRIEDICRDYKPLIEVKPMRSLKVGIVTTGSEVYHGRIKDQFGPVVVRKVEELGCRVMGPKLVSDNPRLIAEAIGKFLDEGAEMIAVTGGMSVDPDDVTPAGIRSSGGRIVTYGAPVLPGAMFMLAYVRNTPVVGLPGCVMYNERSIFDLILPRILAGEEITRGDFVRLAHGGLCSHCGECRFPNCSFGKNG